MSTELTEVRQLYENNKKSRLIEQTKNIEDKT